MKIKVEVIKNIFITGRPGCGKTTLIREIIKELNLPARGFFTQEIRKKGIRKGFKIVSLDGKKGILAHINVKSPYRVSKYKVNIQDLEEIGVKSILDSLKENKLLVIDEIGKMELFSEKFKQAVLAALNSKNKVLGTIKMRGDAFTDKIRARKDTRIFHLRKKNFRAIKAEIKKILEQSDDKLKTTDF